jgi:hypothetical protein
VHADGLHVVLYNVILIYCHDGDVFASYPVTQGSKLYALLESKTKRHYSSRLAWRYPVPGVD